MAGFAEWQTNVQQKAPTGAVTSGGPPEVGSTYGQYTPQSFAQQGEQSKFGPGGQYSGGAGSTQPAPWTPQQSSSQSAQPQSWAQQTASWSANQPSYSAVPQAQQGYTPTGYNPSGSTSVQGSTAAPFGGWNQQQPAQPSGGGAAAAIQNAYRQYLGRDATAQEIAARINQRGFNLQEHIEGIASSPEAYQNYQRQQQGGNQAQSGQPGRGVLPGEQPGGQQPMQDGGYRSQGDRASDAVAQAYQQYLGRNPSPGEVAGWRNNPNAVAEIAGSAEARKRGPAQVDPRSWNTDGYTPPGYIAQRPSSAPPAGWEAGKWNDPSHQTPKYVIGRILSQYQPSVQGAAQAAQELARAYPGAQFNGKDKVMIPGVGVIDVLQNSGSGQNMRWQFGVEEQGGGGGGQAPAGAPGGYDPMSAMYQLLAGAQGGGQPQPGYAQDPAMAQELAALRAQLAQFQQVQSTQQAEAQAAQQRGRGPQFSYF